MKKVALALGSAFMLFAGTLKAQEQPWSFGVKAGGGMSSLLGLGKKKFGNNQSDSGLAGVFEGGLTTGYAFHENVGVGLELLYNTSGGSATEKFQNKNNNAKANEFHIRTQNLVMPLMIKFFPMDYDPEEGILDVHLGLQGMWTFSSSVEKTASGKVQEDKSFKGEYIKPLNVGIIAGVEYEFPEIGLSLGGKFHYGFMDIFKNETKANEYKESNDLKGVSLTNNYATASLGYNFARLMMD